MKTRGTRSATAAAEFTWRSSCWKRRPKGSMLQVTSKFKSALQHPGWLVVLAWLLVALRSAACHHVDSAPINPIKARNDNSTRQAAQPPYWYRSGCHRVGHTRIISIPGCARFEVTTNACRGYCMSYSIPMIENSETMSLPHPSEQVVALDEASLQGASQFSNERSQQTPSVLILPIEGSPDAPGALRASRKQHNRWPTSFQLPSHNSDISGSDDKQTERRDVVSYSQCCNMIRAEEKVYNATCHSGWRLIVFKSAVSCKCLFCKHI